MSASTGYSSNLLSAVVETIHKRFGTSRVSRQFVRKPVNRFCSDNWNTGGPALWQRQLGVLSAARIYSTSNGKHIQAGCDGSGVKVAYL
jgi:hypothetical protein